MIFQTVNQFLDFMVVPNRRNQSFIIMKYPKKAQEREQLDISYTNNIYSEYIGCHIFQMLGVETQQTVLGTYQIKEVILCKDFVDDNDRLYEFAQIKNSIPNEQGTSGCGTEPSEHLDALGQQTIYQVQKLKDYFWDMFIVDAFIGNFDRHNGNWGFIINKKDAKVKIAPVYDCGSCRYPKLSDEKMDSILSNSDEIKKRVYDFPNSAIKENGKKINYFRLINSLEYEDCNNALERMMKRIDIKEVSDFIDSVPNITDIRCRFYKTMLGLRYNLILHSSFIKLAEKQQAKNPLFFKDGLAYDEENER